MGERLKSVGKVYLRWRYKLRLEWLMMGGIAITNIFNSFTTWHYDHRFEKNESLPNLRPENLTIPGKIVYTGFWSAFSICKGFIYALTLEAQVPIFLMRWYWYKKEGNDPVYFMPTFVPGVAFTDFIGTICQSEVGELTSKRYDNYRLGSITIKSLKLFGTISKDLFIKKSSNS